MAPKRNNPGPQRVKYSLFGEFLRAPVSEGGVEPLVVGPPHAVVGAMPQLLDRGVAVPAHEPLLQQPVRRLGHGVLPQGSPLRDSDPLISNTSSSSSIPVSSNLPPRSVWNTRTSVNGKSRAANAPSTRPASRAVRTVCACTRPHAPSAHDAADAPPGRGAPLLSRAALIFGAVASAAVAPDRAHVAGDRIRTLRPGMPGHPVVGGAGNARHPADIGRRWPVSRLPSCEYRHRGVDRAMSYSALISRDGLPLSHDCATCRLNALS